MRYSIVKLTDLTSDQQKTILHKSNTSSESFILGDLPEVTFAVIKSEDGELKYLIYLLPLHVHDGHTAIYQAFDLNKEKKVLIEAFKGPMADKNFILEQAILSAADNDFSYLITCDLNQAKTVDLCVENIDKTFKKYIEQLKKTFEDFSSSNPAYLQNLTREVEEDERAVLPYISELEFKIDDYLEIIAVKIARLGLDIDEPSYVDLSIEIAKLVDKGIPVLDKTKPRSNVFESIRNTVVTTLRSINTLIDEVTKKEIASSIYQSRKMIAHNDLSGQPISDLMVEAGIQRKVFLQQDQLVAYLINLTQNIKNMHAKQIIYRDICAENILINTNEKTLKLAGFYSARLKNNPDGYSGDNIRIKNVLLAPEISEIINEFGEFSESVQYTEKTDIFDLGVFFAELVLDKRISDYIELLQSENISRRWRDDSELCLFEKIFEFITEAVEREKHHASDLEKGLIDLTLDMMSYDLKNRPSLEQISLKLKNIASLNSKFKAQELNMDIDPEDDILTPNSSPVFTPYALAYKPPEQQEICDALIKKCRISQGKM